MSLRFLCAIGGLFLLFTPVQTGAQESTAQIGRIDLDKNFAIEYRVVPFDMKQYNARRGGVGPMFGTDGGPPFNKLDRLTFFLGKERIPLDVSYMYNPSFGKVERRQFSVRQISPRRLVLTGTFSDAAGAYTTEWLIMDGVSVRTRLANDFELKPRPHEL
jgi:hypothetical protein